MSGKARASFSFPSMQREGLFACCAVVVLDGPDTPSVMSCEIEQNKESRKTLKTLNGNIIRNASSFSFDQNVN